MNDGLNLLTRLEPADIEWLIVQIPCSGRNFASRCRSSGSAESGLPVTRRQSCDGL